MIEPASLPGNSCSLHRTHGSAKPLRTVLHHVWPLGMGGPNTSANKVLACDTGHYNIHALLDWLVETVTIGALSSEPGAMNRERTDTRYLLGLLRARKTGSRSERQTAVRGFLGWHYAGRPQLDQAANPE